eukprot:8775171-Pyramimonas_sp.AAC.1
MPSYVKVISPFCLQPPPVCYCCLIWEALPYNAEGGARPAGVGVAAIALVVRAARFWLAPQCAT